MAGPELPKPAYGQLCNFCGLCCKSALCPVAEMRFGETAAAPCPALVSGEAGRHFCGMVADPGKWLPACTLRSGAEVVRLAMLTALGSGVGCDAQAHGEKVPAHIRMRMRDQARKAADQGHVHKVLMPLILGDEDDK